jgi:CheY-like chemotaxis protein
MRPQKRILTCINEPDLTRYVSLCLQNEFAQQYELSVREAHHIDNLLAKSESDPPDLFILLLNNMFYSYSHIRHRGEKKHRIKHLLEVITRLKETSRKPVIALTAWPQSPDSWNEENTKQAGASFLFILPLEGNLLRDAARQCLELKKSSTSI